MKTKVAERINEGLEKHDFGFTDSKGRAIGCQIARQVVVFEEIPEDSRSYYNLAPGTYYAWVGTSTRNGEAFGALQATHYCTTEAERFEQVEKYLKDAKKRAAKK